MSDKKKVVIALGYFDSVHIGHRKVINKAIIDAKINNALSVVFSFSVSPKKFLFGKEYKSVYTAKERSDILNSLGVGEVFFAQTDFEFLSKDKFEFLRFLDEKYDVIEYVCGEDYRFGNNAEGDFAFLKSYAESHDRRAVCVETEYRGGEKISSTQIEKLLMSGDVKMANMLLCDKYRISGTVFKDRMIGRTLGFPTVNIKVPRDKAELYSGVYYGHIFLDKRYKTIINYGTRPTYNLTDKLVEAHIIGYDGLLYGKEITLFFDGYLRDIQKFGTEEELTERLRQDLIETEGKNYD